MRNLTKKKISLSAIILILEFFILFNNHFTYYLGGDSGNLESKDEQKLKMGGYWNISPFTINGNSGWDTLNSTYEWCNGSGSLMHPFIIENVTINAGWVGSCITVQSSSVYFLIRNCTFYNSGANPDDAGIKLENTNNGKLFNNTCINNNRNGILLENSNYNIITNNSVNNNNIHGIELNSNSNDNDIIGNILKYNSKGIFLTNCLYNNISNNISYDNNEDGIHLSHSDDNILSMNVVDDNNWNGIWIYRSDNIVINNNTAIRNSDNGIKVGEVSYYSEIFKNSIKLNGYGILLDESLYNNITDNEILSNNYGADIDSFSYYNLFVNNTFKNNNLNARDDGASNDWDNGIIGNYYSDYGGVDANDDHIGDTPYDITGTAGSKDNYPIWDDGINPPEVIINFPSMLSAFSFNSPDFNITINDANPINSTWYTIDGGVTNYTFSGLTGTVNQSAWDNKGTELITLRFYANDSLGHLGFEDVTIWKDLVAPEITINAPTPNQLCGVDAPTFTLTIVEPNIQTKRYSINGRPNITFTAETQFSQSEWNNIGNGTVSITFYVIDKVGNVNSSEVMVRKDAFVPDITIHTPLSDESFGNTAPEFSISIIEEDLFSTWYTIQGGLFEYLFTGLNGTIDQDAWNNLPYHTNITIIFYALDRAGNIGTENLTVIKIIFPGGFFDPSFTILIFVGCGFVGIIYLIIKKRRQTL